MSYRNLSLYVYDISGSLVQDPAFERAYGYRAETRYPAGLFGTCSFFIPGLFGKRATQIEAGYEVRIQDRAFMVYQGVVRDIEEQTQDGQAGLAVVCEGAWDRYMEGRGMERLWADDRLNYWYQQTTASGSELATHDTRDRLRITPKAEAWANTEFYRLQYDAPTGETVGQTSVNFDLQEAAQTWTLQLAELPATTIFTASTSGTGTDTSTTTTGPSSISFQLQSGAAQTPTSDGTYYAEISNVTMYAGRDHASATLGNVNAYEVALDIVDRLAVDETIISTDLDGLDSSLTLSIAPFISKGWETYGSQLARAAFYGTSGQAAIGYYLNDPILSSDNKPKLVLETYPSLTAEPEYAMTMEEGQVSVRLNGDEIFNYIIMEYEDDEGKQVRRTPADDANLTDAASVAQYGQRETVISIGRASSTTAADYGRRFLARHKQPTYAVTRPVRVSRLRHYKGQYIPARQVRAGQRVRVVDLPNTSGQGSPTGTTFLITKTQYDHDAGMVSISLGGTPDSLAIYLAQIQKGIV